MADARNSRGFSLIELLIAMVIIMISMLALLTSIVASMRTNLQNDVRDTAIRLTNQTAEAILALPINDPELDPAAGTPVGTHSRILDDAIQAQKGFPNTRQIVRGSRQNYSIQWKVTAPSANIKRAEITVSYKFRNQDFSNVAFIDKHSSI